MVNMNAYLRWISLIIPPLGFLLNFTLFWLILRRTPKEMRLHSRVLLQTCIMDILLLILYMFGMMYAAFIDDDKLLLFFEGYMLASKLTKLNSNQNWNLFICWHFLYTFDVFGIAVQFLYRYLSLNREIQINFRRYLSILFVPFIISFLTAYFSLNFVMSNTLMNGAEIAKLSGLSLEFNEDSIFMVIQMNEFFTKMSMILYTMYNLICYSIIIFCGRQMIRFVASHAMSDHLKNLNKQLTTNLIIYAIYPIIFQATYFLLYLSNIFNSMSNIVFLTCISHWLPVLNPLATLWTFRPYRDALIGPFRKAQILPIE